MPAFQVCLAILLLTAAPVALSDRDGSAVWDSRCEECHGDSRRFAGKFLWNIGGKLQGQHHIDDLALFMRNHYIPDHEIKAINLMLLAQANSTQRFTAECSECHGAAATYVEQKLWVSGSGITTRESGADVSILLPGHQGLDSDDASFFLTLLSRIAGSPLKDGYSPPDDGPSLEFR